MESNGIETNGVHFAKGSKAQFLDKVSQIILKDVIVRGSEQNGKVVEFIYPDQLKQQIDLKIKKDGVPDETLYNLCRQTIKYCVKSGHRNFHNQLYAGVSHYGIAGSWLTDAINTTPYTYEVGPVFTLMEEEIVNHMAGYVGYKTKDGIFCPGGSTSNLYGLNLARYHRFPQVKTEGMRGVPEACMFTSKQAHYSIDKAVALVGLGLNSMIRIDCDESGRMKPVELEKAVIAAKAKGIVPFYVHATSGTTVAGGYDPLEAIADICSRHNMWLHVDGCWGGGALLSSKHRHLLKGVERSDSFAWNPHKMMGAPQQCSVFLTKHTGLLSQCHSSCATYLFQKDKFYDVSYDTGDKSLQCGRKVDVFKLWLMWKAKGDNGFEDDINNIFEQADYLRERLRARKGFRMVLPKEDCTNVCFWFVPPCLRGLEETPEWWQRLAKVCVIAKERMIKSGTLMISYLPLGDKVNFFRMIVASSETTREDMDFVVDEIERLACDIEV